MPSPSPFDFVEKGSIDVCSNCTCACVSWVPACASCVVRKAGVNKTAPFLGLKNRDWYRENDHAARTTCSRQGQRTRLSCGLVPIPILCLLSFPAQDKDREQDLSLFLSCTYCLSPFLSFFTGSRQGQRARLSCGLVPIPIFKKKTEKTKKDNWKCPA